MTAALRFDNVHKRFGERHVLRGVCAELPAQGLTFVVGKSGTGKSVLCRLAVGLLKADEGNIELLGQSVSAASERALMTLRASAPYLVQGPALLDWLSARQNVALANKDPSAVDEALEIFGLSAIAEQSPTRLSPGVQKRIALARAWVLRPKYVLLDEPTTGLDPTATAQVNEALGELRKRGVGALVVSHDHRAVEAWADQVLELEEGQVVFNGTAQEFRTR